MATVISSSKANPVITRLCVSLFVLFTWTHAAHARVVTLDFDHGSGGMQTDPFYEDGFRWTVKSCHYDIVPSDSTNPEAGSWMGIDGSGCNSTWDDVDTHPAIRLDAYGEIFNLVSIEISGDVRALQSSKGNLFQPTYSGDMLALVSFHDDGWTDLKWIDFLGFPIGSPVGWDNVRVRVRDVPEPSALLLAALGLGALASVRPTQLRQAK